MNMPPFTWRPLPSDSAGREVEVILADDANPDSIIAMIEDFGYAAYPCAINSKTGNIERGGAYWDRVEAKLWAERVVGLHPLKPSDERPPFYYENT
jgi:hypothetical protein